jgi:hypothetical protein
MFRLSVARLWDALRDPRWIALVMSLAYLLHSWGYIEYFQGDYGRWLGEIERFAKGERPYTGFDWAFPPLSMWLVGSYARLFGADLPSIWVLTSLVTVLISLLFACLVRSIAPRSAWTPITVGGLLLAYAMSTLKSAPLSMGMYTPAAPIGLMFLLAALVLSLKLEDEPGGLLLPFATGALAGLAIITKQDFWLPALVVIGFAAAGSGIRTKGAVTRAVAALVGGATPVLLAVAWLTRHGSSDILLGIATGFGHVRYSGPRGLPSQERLTVNALALALLGLAWLAPQWRSRTARIRLVTVGSVAAVLAAVHLTMTIAIAQRGDGGVILGQARSPTEVWLGRVQGLEWGPLIGGLNLLRIRVEQNLLPVLATVAIGLLALWLNRRVTDVRTRRMILFLALFCLAARVRRGFDHMEWFHVLIELPTLGLLLSRIGGRTGEPAHRPVAGFMTAMAGAAALIYWDMGVGPGTRTGAQPAIETPRGAVHLTARSRAIYQGMTQLLGRIDPQQARPLFAWPRSQGYNYFFGRPNPTPFTIGLNLTAFEPEKAAEMVLAATPSSIVVMARHVGSLRPSPVLDLTRWETPRTITVPTADLDRLAPLRTRCARVDNAGRVVDAALLVLDCAEPPRTEIRSNELEPLPGGFDSPDQN